ncbi:histidine kinase with GAF domain [Sanguibacter keddieii DSM 10542]|uniref:Histidine kinase with GAF domain n=1 Tax=Sanguibacter keddieii (strain ATCC 51767 / DSM 10542 / NCFB 3025 / ST-74) TaxID=446469 RepID=D1BDL6_SANKS|nr:GAF domain-containing protein [Sanguibacter keddieii]ACZ21078.1 histidine kinase with GAF domain [Sanguibacter keddieii DSM 10542]
MEREKWLSAGAHITTMLLSGAPEEDVLEHIVSVAREIADADAACLVLPGLGGELVMEIVRGWNSDELLGQTMPHGGLSWTALRSGKGRLVPSLAVARNLQLPPMRRFGPALYAPMGTAEKPVGVLVLLRKVGQEAFISKDLERASTFADQAALALVLSEARQAQDLSKLVEERERIARDLHDLAIQQLFATGMQLETVRRRAARGLDKAGLISILDEALDNVDNSVREIRAIVHSLRDPDAATGLVERLRREASLARTGLGFAPSLVISLDDRSLGAIDDDEELVDELVSQALADDILAVVREGLANAARHAQASSVAVRVTVATLHEGPGDVTVEVEDDGVGLGAPTGRKSGTWNVAARARQHGGSSSLENSATGRGTILTWSAPLVERS